VMISRAANANFLFRTSNPPEDFQASCLRGRILSERLRRWKKWRSEYRLQSGFLPNP
jgi:hypothetical protein